LKLPSCYKKPDLEVADIFRKYQRLLPPQPLRHYRVIQHMLNCRTEVLGGHLLGCNNCDNREYAYRSCRDRHCGKCQFMARVKWIEKRKEELLPCEYFHIVFTIPAILRQVVLMNKEVIYNILFKSSADTLKEVARNPDNLGAEIGFFGILHTWSQVLIDHPHVHYVVAGGGLDKNKNKWISCKSGFFVSVKKLSKTFKGKFIYNLIKAYRNGELKFKGKIKNLNNEIEFDNLIKEAQKPNWNVYAKEPFSGPREVLNYLGQYTHRIAISNHRLIKVENNKVCFSYRDRSNENEKKVMALDIVEFMRRFLLHILPAKFMRIRHFGLLGNRYKRDNLTRIRELLEVAIAQLPTENLSLIEYLKKIIGIDITICKKCKKGTMSIIGLIGGTLNTC